MKKIISSALLLSLLFVSACATSQVPATGPGFIYTDHYEGVLVTSNQAGKRRGEACNTNILGLFTSGDASLSAAMKSGAIVSVSSVDHYFHSVLGVYGKMCTIVTGN